MTTTAPRTREDIRDEEAGESFPQYLLVGCETALVLFAAGFLGKQDAFWIAEAGLTATCIDSDAERLGEMMPLYPYRWAFLHDDAFDYATDTRRKWDVVTVDCPSGAFARCSGMVDVWCSRARVAVVLGTGFRTIVTAPEGWRVTERRRRSSHDGGVYWTVLERTGA